MKEIYLIRHTTPAIEKGICYGNTDLSVNENFNNEAAEINNHLENTTTSNVFSSPLKRCSQLADTLFPTHTIQYDNRLKELDFGHWELKAWTSINKDAIKTWSEDFMNLSPPNGENFSTLYQRSINCFNEITKSIAENDSAAIVTHSGVIRCLLMKYL